MTTTRKAVPLALFTIAAVAVLMAMVAGQTHADTKHLEAPAVRAAVRNGLCIAKEVWFAPTSGRILILCQLEVDSSVWGGWVLFVTQNQGTEPIPPHESTCFAGSEGYWRWVIKRDGYTHGWQFPAVLDHAADTLGVPLP